MQYTLRSIDELDELPDTLAGQFNELVTQLSRNPEPVSLNELTEVQRRTDSELLLCAFSENDTLVGIVQGTFLCTPPAYRFFINTTVVHESERGKGLGTLLMNEVMQRAKTKWPHINKVVLSNRPSRKNADFYTSLGFTPRTKDAGDETVVFVKDLRT